MLPCVLPLQDKHSDDGERNRNASRWSFLFLSFFLFQNFATFLTTLAFWVWSGKETVGRSRNDLSFVRERARNFFLVCLFSYLKNKERRKIVAARFMRSLFFYLMR